MTIQILETEDIEDWLAVLEQARQYDFHHLPQYHLVAEQCDEGKAHFFVHREGDYMIALPLLLRPVQATLPGGWYDATSVYGYGGPVASHDAVPEAIVRNFQAELTEALRERRVVSVFSRLHPLIPQHEILNGIGECPVSGTTVSIDLTRSEDEMRAHYTKNCRASIRKLREAGFIGLQDHDKRYLPEFVDVYRETMHRVGAHSSYHFDQAYFDLLVRELEGASHLFVVMKDGMVAAATLCTLCDGIVQDHLGGSRDAFLKHSPDRLVVDTIRAWAKEAGARVYHLGGGVGAKEDSLFRYKSGFSGRRHAYSTFRWVLLPEVYAELSAHSVHWSEGVGPELRPTNYFPAYRCG